jgi:hypothetical protein
VTQIRVWRAPAVRFVTIIGRAGAGGGTGAAGVPLGTVVAVRPGATYQITVRR